MVDKNVDIDEIISEVSIVGDSASEKIICSEENSPVKLFDHNTIFLLIIIGFSIVGILKTFETDLLHRFPDMEYIFKILDQQLIFVSETVKNMITIFNDLIDSY